MTRTALVLEIEGLLFDTDRIRHQALCAALVAEGVACESDAVWRAIVGVPTHAAVRVLGDRTLDETGHALVIRRAIDAVSEALAVAPPDFDAGVRDHVRTLAAEYPIGVVTRGSYTDARLMLDAVELDGCIGTVRSLSEYVSDDTTGAWREAVTRLHADRGVAIAPAATLPAAMTPGVRAIEVLRAGTVSIEGQPAAFARVTSAVINALFLP